MKRNNSGTSLMAVMIAIVSVAIILGAVFTITTTEARFMKRGVDRAAAIAYGDGVLENLFDQWRMAMVSTQDATQHSQGLTANELKNGTATSPATSVPAGLPMTLPTSSQLPVPTGVSLSSWNIQAANPYLAALDTNTRPIAENGTNSRLRVRLYYIATAVVNFPRGQVTVRRIFTRAGRNIFDNFLFSTQPITEIHPGAPMYVNGTIYAGGNLYMASDNLHLLKDTTFTGSMTLDYKGGTGISSSLQDPRYGNTAPTIGSSGLADNFPNGTPHSGGQQKLLDTPISLLDPNFLDDPISNNTDSDGNPNNNGYREIVKPVTDSTKSDPLQVDTSGGSERLINSADYRIYVNASNSVSIYKGASTTPLASTTNDYIAIMGALTTNTAIKDVREGDNVRLANLDISKINTALTGNKISDNVGSNDGLVLYFQDTSAGTSVTANGYRVSGSSSVATTLTSSSKRGLRLLNGGTIPSIGLTIATPNPVYIQGDYNTGTSGSTQPPSNANSAYGGSTDPSPTVSGYTKSVSVIVADAVNILSNNWSDSSAIISQSAGNAPTATDTTINAAIVAGNVPTTSSSYSGGIENFPRFHENWSGQYFTIYGSFALLFDSEQALGTWSNALYSPPDRHWYFDSTLQDKNPPGFPVAYSYDRGRWQPR
jgi:hypothetical protein